MIKRTLYFGNPAYLSLKNSQLLVKLPEVEKADMPEEVRKKAMVSVPIEDIGLIILDHKQITITQALLEQFMESNCVVITCGSNKMPVGMLLPLTANTTQSERVRYQVEASEPLKKQLWQQTVMAKVENQATVLRQCRNEPATNMAAWIKEVKSGDSTNIEARAATYYWKNLFPSIQRFTRNRDGLPPNNALNYGYAILRSIIARALVGSGLLPTLGIFHRNKYNAYCLADDIMEPYRPFVDRLVVEMVDSNSNYAELTQEIKMKLLSLPTVDVMINGKRSPLMVAAGFTTASLQRCYAGESKKISYPVLP